MKVEEYRERWMKEQEHYKLISENLMEVKTEVHDLKLKVEIVEGETIPKTQELVKTISQGDHTVRIDHCKGNKKQNHYHVTLANVYNRNASKSKRLIPT